MASMNSDSASSESTGSSHCLIVSVVRLELLQYLEKWLSLLHLWQRLPYAGHCFRLCTRPQQPQGRLDPSGNFLASLVTSLRNLCGLLLDFRPNTSPLVSALYLELFLDSASTCQTEIAFWSDRSSICNSRCLTSSEFVPQTILSRINWSSRSP